MSRDPMAGKYQQWFRHEFAVAALILKDVADGQLYWGTADYEAFRFLSPRVRLIFYPHKTRSSGNINVRVRDASSPDRALAMRLMKRLYIGSARDNTFSHKDMGLNDMLDYARQAGLTFGWADKEVRGEPR